MIIDAHAHLVRGYGSVELYLKQLHDAGIDGGVVVPGGMVDVRRLTDYVTGKAAPSSDPPDNQYVQDATKAHPELAGFFCVDPHADGAVEALIAAFEAGSRGLKLSPLSHRFSFSGRAVAELVECAQAFGLPVYSHVLYNPAVSTEKFVALAKQFPTVPFILGHMGFGPADPEAIEAATELDNFYLETSTGNPLQIRQAIERAGPGKVIFGSEFPLSHPKVELEKILCLGLPDEDQERVLWRNIYELARLSEVWKESGR